MRVVLDTNILISAIMVRGTPPDSLYEQWRHGRFDLVSCERQIEEINRVSRRPSLRDKLRPSETGRMINDIRRLAVMCDPLPTIAVSPDPDDDYLLAAAEVSRSDFLVTGDKSGLLRLKRHGVTRIVTARYLAERLEK